MDDVQLENGYTTIANEILEQIAKIKLSPTQYRLIFVIWRYTYGFKRKEHKLSLAFLSEATGCDKRQIQRELKELSDRKVIYQLINVGKNRVIGFNKRYSEWVDSVTIGDTTIGETVIGETDNGQTTNSTIGETVNSAIGETTNQEINNIKQNIKTSIYSVAELEILECWNSKNIIKHKQTIEMQKAIQTALKKFKREKIIKAIDNYTTIFRDESYFYSYTWKLDKFLKQANGLPDFLEDGQQWINYRARAKPPDSKDTEKREVYK